MNKTLPDKWIRKAVFDLVNNMTVGEITIPCFDVRVTGGDLPENFILLSTQSNAVDKNNKCEFFWESDLLVDIVTSYDKAGNVGSRALADDILDEVRNLTQNLQLDPESGLNIITITQDFPPDITAVTDNENIFRKFIRYELLIN